MSQREAAHQHVVENQARHLERVREFMAQPSVSQENQGMEECAELLLRYYQELGCKEAEIAETPVFPAVWAYYDAGRSQDAGGVQLL